MSNDEALILDTLLQIKLQKLGPVLFWLVSSHIGMNKYHASKLFLRLLAKGYVDEVGGLCQYVITPAGEKALDGWDFEEDPVGLITN